MWIPPCELYYRTNTAAGLLASERPGSQSGSNLVLQPPPWRTVRITKRRSRKQWRKKLLRQSVPKTNPKREMVCTVRGSSERTCYCERTFTYGCALLSVFHPDKWCTPPSLLTSTHEGACVWTRTVIYGFSVCTPLWPICVEHAHVTW